MNPADYTLAMTGIEKMLTWIGLYRDRRRSVDDEKRKEMKIALESLVAAASKTRQYQATNRNIVPAQNAELAALWNKAAMDIWSIDVELAELYLLKGDYWSEGEESRLLHPLTDDLNQHIVEERTGSLQARTVLGQIFIDQLQLNRTALIENRLERQRLARIESQLIDITGTLRAILSEIKSKDTSPE